MFPSPSTRVWSSSNCFKLRRERARVSRKYVSVNSSESGSGASVASSFGNEVALRIKRVRRQRFVGRERDKLAGHAQVRRQQFAGCELEEDVLATTADAGDRRILELSSEGGARKLGCDAFQI